MKLYRGLGSGDGDGGKSSFVWFTTDRTLAERYSRFKTYPPRVVEWDFNGKTLDLGSAKGRGKVTEFLSRIPPNLSQKKAILELRSRLMKRYGETKNDWPSYWHNDKDILRYIELSGFDSIKAVEQGEVTVGVMGNLVPKEFHESLVIRIDKLLEAYWGTAAAGILPIAKDTGRILVAMRSSYVNEPNTYGVWGGAIHADETPKEGAKREFTEETKYKGSLKMIEAYRFEDGTFMYQNFIGIVEYEFKPHLDWETESYVWLDFDELLKLRPKHFGLESLIKNSRSLIQTHAKPER